MWQEKLTLILVITFGNRFVQAGDFLSSFIRLTTSDDSRNPEKTFVSFAKY